MTQHNYTHVIDMSNSEAFYAGFYDDVEKVLYLTFNNGTTSTRRVPAETTPEDVEEIDSWGRQWWSTLKGMPEGPTVEPGDEFVYRAAPAVDALAEQDSDSATVSDDVWVAFRDDLIARVSRYDEEWFVEDYEDELRESLAVALAAQAEPTGKRRVACATRARQCLGERTTPVEPPGTRSDARAERVLQGDGEPGHDARGGAARPFSTVCAGTIRAWERRRQRSGQATRVGKALLCRCRR